METNIVQSKRSRNVELKKVIKKNSRGLGEVVSTLARARNVESATDQ